jgi:hypothetical protein
MHNFVQARIAGANEDGIGPFAYLLGGQRGDLSVDRGASAKNIHAQTQTQQDAKFHAIYGAI